MEKKDNQNNGISVSHLFPTYDLICTLVVDTQWEFKDRMLMYKQHIEQQYPEVKRFRDDLIELLNKKKW